MGKKTKLGKIVLNHKGYSIRHITKSKTDEKTKKVTQLHTGKFGIYSGKKLFLDGIHQPKDGIPLIEKEINDNSMKKKLAAQAYIRKMKLINSLTRRTWE
ncbi:MAG: hypothetical protein Q7W13_13155 [Bacteroidia bacterium]|nr:hypothetical protein [Bacteroidia bacterium]